MSAAEKKGLTLPEFEHITPSIRVQNATTELTRLVTYPYSFN
jgi:hypothetical protein